MPPNSVLSMRWIWASSSLARTPSAQAANLTSSSSAVRLPVKRQASRRPAKILCSTYQGDHSPFRSKPEERMSPRATSAKRSRAAAPAPPGSRRRSLSWTSLQLPHQVVGPLLEARVAGRGPHHADGREVVAGDVAGEVLAVAVPAAVGLGLGRQAGADAEKGQHAVGLELPAGTRRPGPGRASAARRSGARRTAAAAAPRRG